MQPLPLSKRPVDIALIVFFCVNLFFITYIVDVEQLVIADANHFQYPIWPPAKMVELVHWYGHIFGNYGYITSKIIFAGKLNLLP